MAEQLYGPDEIAKLFEFDGVRRIDQLVQDGVLKPVIKKENGRNVRKYDLIPTIQSYIRYLKEKAERKLSISDPITEEQILQADLRYKTARAGKMELELNELKGMMHRAEDVELITADMIAGVRAGILALPGRLAVDAAEARTPAEASAVIKDGVDELLNNMSKYRYDPVEYRKRVRERAKWAAEDQVVLDEEVPKKTAKKTAKSTKSTAKPKTAKTTVKKASSKQTASSKASAGSSKPRKT